MNTVSAVNRGNFVLSGNFRPREKKNVKCATTLELTGKCWSEK